jgi:hypothetical protein
MSLQVIDTLGMKCPQRLVQIAVKVPDVKPMCFWKL